MSPPKEDAPGTETEGTSTSFVVATDSTAPLRGQRGYRTSHVGGMGTVFQYGHRMGRSDAARRLWRYLSPEGRQLARVIAAEGRDEE